MNTVAVSKSLSIITWDVDRFSRLGVAAWAKQQDPSLGCLPESHSLQMERHTRLRGKGWKIHSTQTEVERELRAGVWRTEMLAVPPRVWGESAGFGIELSRPARPESSLSSVQGGLNQNFQTPGLGVQRGLSVSRYVNSWLLNVVRFPLTGCSYILRIVLMNYTFVN